MSNTRGETTMVFQTRVGVESPSVWIQDVSGLVNITYDGTPEDFHRSYCETVKSLHRDWADWVLSVHPEADISFNENGYASLSGVPCSLFYLTVIKEWSN